MRVLRVVLDIGALVSRFIMWCLRRIGLILVISAVALAVSLVTVTVPAMFNAISSIAEAVTDLALPKSKAATVRQRTTSRQDSAKREADALRGQIADLDAERSGLRTRLDAKVNELDDLKRRTTVNYRGRNLAVRDAVSDTSERLSSRVRRATARNLATMPGEALPILGVAVVAGATAWEVKDACEMMKDMHALDLAFNPDHEISEREVCGARVPTTRELWVMIKASPKAVWDSATAQVADLPEVNWASPYHWVVDLASSVGDRFWGMDAEVAAE